MANAYGKGPLGVAEEDIEPIDLVAEAYERLAPEDQISLKKLAATASSSMQLQEISVADNVIGDDFSLDVPTVEYGNPTIQLFSLPNPKPGQLLNLTWATFGFGVERIISQIKNLGRRVEVDACFGINEAGLVMATFLASAQFGRCPIGYLKCIKDRDGIAIDDASVFPKLREAPTIILCDFEVKHADVIGFISANIRRHYPAAEIYFAVFGAMTKDPDLKIESFDQLTGAEIMRAANLSAVFIAATMNPPGIEPPLELR
ncbi:hypothetical protein [Acrocarpospora catenulata]|uniref:hypothetical protein n=1 Tax=Acrocarpospora catenulata TaxID=2836182 RepID=UPI001BD9A35C|nr:hypothetical protein [Acrocarpospora catenulata]